MSITGNLSENEQKEIPEIISDLKSDADLKRTHLLYCHPLRH